MYAMKLLGGSKECIGVCADPGGHVSNIALVSPELSAGTKVKDLQVTDWGIIPKVA